MVVELDGLDPLVDSELSLHLRGTRSGGYSPPLHTWND